jgi:hypothetical protein
MDFNTPSVVKDPASFQRAASKIGYTFNWFYADSEHIAYFNSGENPVRAVASTTTSGRGEYEWRGWNPDTCAPASRRSPSTRRWSTRTTSSTEQQAGARVRLLRRERVLVDVPVGAARGPREGGHRGGEELDAAGLIEAMELAGTGDLRAHVDLPLALKVIGAKDRREPRWPAARLAARRRAAQGRDGDKGLRARDAIRIIDAWWPLWLKAQFQPVLGKAAFDTLASTIATDNSPNGAASTTARPTRARGTGS